MKTSIYRLTLITLFLLGIAQAQNINVPNVKGPGGVQVNSLDGNMFYQRSDLFIKGLNLPLDVMFSYNASQKQDDWGYGKGWSFNYGQYYEVDTNGVTLHRADGRKDFFLLFNGSYVPPIGIFDSWEEYQQGKFKLRMKDGMTYYFEDSIHRKITKIENRIGNEIIFTYSGSLLSNITNDASRSVSFSWGNGHLISISDANASPVQSYAYLYDADNRLIEVTDPIGGKMTFDYTTEGDLDLIKDYNNNPIQLNHYDNGQVKEIVSCNSRMSFVYNPKITAEQTDNRTYVMEQNSAGIKRTTYIFDLERNLIRMEDGCCGQDAVYEHDVSKNMTRQVDANGNITNMGYDDRGNMISITDALGNLTTLTYDSVFSQVQTITDARGNTSTFTYDQLGNIIRAQRPGNVVEELTYNSDGKITSYKDASGETTTVSYNSIGDLTQINFPIGTEQFTYDGRGNLLTEKDANNQITSYVYDKLNRVIEVSDPLGHNFKLAYDNNGNINQITDEKGYITTYTYDALDRLTAVNTPVGSYQYQYDQAGNLLQLTDPNGNSTLFTYNERNLLTSKTDPEGNLSTYDYDPNDNLISTTTANGDNIVLTYDALNRLIQRSYGSNTDSYTYDVNGNLSGASNQHISYSYTYDALNRLTEKRVNTWNKSISYTYDDFGNRTRMTDPEGGITNYQYDANHRLTSITNPDNLTTQFAYDAEGRLTRQDNGNGTYSLYSYDQDDNLLSIFHHKSNGDTLAFNIYTYDPNKNMTSMRDMQGLHEYYYDRVDRIDSVKYANGDIEVYRFDGHGNRIELRKNSISTQYSYDAADRMIQAGNTHFIFDENGNVTQEIALLDTIRYKYDELDRLTLAHSNSSNLLENQYDPFGIRIQKKDSSGTVYRYLLDESNILSEYDGNNSLKKRFTSGISADSWMIMKVGAQNYFYHQDVINSTIVLSDNLQTTSEYNSYNIFGEIISNSGNIQNPFLYTGREAEKSMGIYYYQSRFYKPITGFFFTQDQYYGDIYSPFSLNKYSYVQGNPIKYRDPFGYSPLPNGIVKKTIGRLISTFPRLKCFVNKSQQVRQNQNARWEKQKQKTQGKVYDPDADIDFIIEDRKKAYKDFLDAAKAGLRWGHSVPLVHTNIPNSNGGTNGVTIVGRTGYGINGCPPTPPTGPQNPPPSPPPGTEWTINRVHAVDPNDILGPEGYGPEQWVSKDDILEYRVRFENDPNFATGPAQKVTITVPLDSSLNPLSFRVGNYGFGHFAQSVTANQAFYTDRLDVRDSLGVFVDVTAGVDILENEAFWIFESIDPVTGLASTVPPLLGFLPVKDTSINRFNDTTINRGEGYVTFSIEPKSTAQTGDTVTAQADIIFDFNAPIATNVAMNIIDALPPTSMLDSIPSFVDSTYDIFCTAVDDSGGVGVASFQIYASENNGPFYLLASDIAKDSTYTFRGTPGESYCFYSRATDWVGNEEGNKSMPERCATQVKFNDITLLAPDGGEKYCSSDTVLIRWESIGIRKLDILASSDNGMNWDTLEQDYSAYAESYAWVLNDSMMASNAYRVQLVWPVNDSVKSISQDPFEISIRPAKPQVVASGPLTFCQGDQVSLTAPNGYSSYSWSNGDSTATIQVNQSQRLNLTVTDINNCVSAPSDSIRVLVNPLPPQPTVSFTRPTVFCQGDSLTLTATAGYAGYLWSHGTSGSQTTIRSTGIYSVSVTDANMCVSQPSAPVMVTVNALPPMPTLTPSGPTRFCDGDSVQIQGPANYAHYFWSTPDTTAQIWVSQNSIISLQVQDANGCFSPLSQTLNIVVDTLPAQPTLSLMGASRFCDGDSTLLEGPLGYSQYIWSDGFMGRQYPITQSGTYELKVKDSQGCESPFSLPQAIVVDSIPAKPLLMASGSPTFCQGDSLTISGPAAYSQYAWNNGDSVASITVFQSGSFALQVTDANGCESPISDSLITMVNALPSTPSLIAQGATTFCFGDSVLITGPTGYLSYQWNTNDTTNTLSVKQSGMYSLAVIDSNSCQSAFSNVVSVLVNALPSQPNILASGPTNLCEGDSVRLTAPSGYTAYRWNNGRNDTSLLIDTSGLFSLVVIDSNSCESPVSAIRAVMVNANPAQPVISGDSSLCAGDSIFLSGPAGFSSYQWSNGDSTQSTQIFAATTLTVSVVDSNACESPVSAPFDVKVIPTPPKPGITAQGITTFCQGDSVLITANQNYMAYSWSTGDTTNATWVSSSSTVFLQVNDTTGCFSPRSDSVEVMVNPLPSKPKILGNSEFCVGDSTTLHVPSGFATYQWSQGASTAQIKVDSVALLYVQVTDSNGCTSPVSDTVLTQINSLPLKPVIQGDSILCEGDSLVLLAPLGFPSYQWSDGSRNSHIFVNMAGVFSVAVTDSNGCTSPASDSLAVISYSVPAKPAILKVGNNQLQSSITGTSYNWYVDGMLLTDTTQSINIPQNGIYTLVVFNGPCFSETSDTVRIATDLDDMILGSIIEIFPNPADNRFFVKAQFDRATLVELQLFTQSGRLINSREVFASEGKLLEAVPVANLASATYVLRIRVNEKMVYRSIEVLR